MPASTDLYYNIDGLTGFTKKIPYDMTVLDARDASDVLKLAAARAMEWFIKNRLPDRFTGFAFSLGYSANPNTWARKKQFARDYNPEAIKPNIMTGRAKMEILNGARVQTVGIGGAKSGNVRAKLIYQGKPSYLNAQTSGVTNRVLETILPKEAAQMADVFFNDVAASMSTVALRNVVNRQGNKITRRISVAPEISQQFGRTTRATLTTARNSGVKNAI
jgi:hypothetical protein